MSLSMKNHKNNNIICKLKKASITSLERRHVTTVFETVVMLLSVIFALIKI